jgi:roadblock/LC7 domain-containing protein
MLIGAMPYPHYHVTRLFVANIAFELCIAVTMMQTAGGNRYHFCKLMCFENSINYADSQVSYAVDINVILTPFTF